MFNLFAKKPKEKMKQSPIDAIKAIEDLSLKIDHMEEKIRFIDTKMKGLNNDAKIRLKNGDKNGARQALAKKKKYDEQIKQYDGAILLMEEQKLMLEGAETMRNIIDSIKKANTILSDSQKVISADEIVNIKEELEEFKYNQKEISDIFTEYTEQENTDVEDELNQMAAEIEKEGLPTALENKPQISQFKKEKVKDEKRLEEFLMQ